MSSGKIFFDTSFIMDVEPYLFIGLYLFSFVDFMITEELQCVNQYKG